MRLALVALTAAAVFAATPLQAEELRDGTYRCIMAGQYHMGDIEISGTSYRGPAYDGRYDDAYEFVQTDDKIIWNGPLGALTEDGNTIDFTQVFPLTSVGGTGFSIQLRAAGATSGTQQIVCRP